VAAKKASTAEQPEKSDAVGSGAPPSFEAAVQKLGEIVEKLESGDLPLEESLALFEQGIRLSRDAQARLDAAEKRVEQLLGFDENGRPLVTPMDVE
jgi:exodeoxyribonuclease VII small subunit